MRFKRGFLAALALAVTLGAATVHASHVPGVSLSGRVTAVTSDSVSIDGHRFRVRAGSPAAQGLTRLKVGQSVTVGLDGAPDDSSAQIVVIQTPTGS